mmetsp:Transcript_7804/g.12949  ORF Transcript_7804/g.12949 Transcript_7804/m.12949 type:complete len:193 (+) Transcript_7804:604-1182(+)
MFLCVVPERSAATLNDIIFNRVRPMSFIYTDCWKGYITDQLQAFGYVHRTVNHSRHFVSTEEIEGWAGIHTNTIEGTWSALKKGVPPRSRTNSSIVPYLIQFVWNRRFYANGKTNHREKWNALMEAIAEIPYLDIHDNNILPPPPDLIRQEVSYRVMVYRRCRYYIREYILHYLYTYSMVLLFAIVFVTVLL